MYHLFIFLYFLSGSIIGRSEEEKEERQSLENVEKANRVRTENWPGPKEKKGTAESAVETGKL